MSFCTDPSAPPGGTGTPANPFNRWPPPTWIAGATYQQRAGVPWRGPTIMPGADGVTLGVYGATEDNPRAIFDGSNVQPGRACISIPGGATNITVQDWDVSGGSGYNLIGSAVSTPACRGLRVLRCVLHDTPFKDFDSNGMSIYGTDTLVEDTDIWGIADDGIWTVDLGSPTVRRSRIYGVGLNPNRQTGDCVQFSRHVGRATVEQSFLSSTHDKQCVIAGNDSGELRVWDSMLLGGAWGINTNLCLGAVDIRRVHFLASLLAESAGTPSAAIFHQGASNVLVESCLVDCNGIWGKGIYGYRKTGPKALITVRNSTLVDNSDIQGEGLITTIGAGYDVVAENCALNSPQRTMWSTISCGTGSNATLRGCSFGAEYPGFVSVSGVRYATLAALEAAGFASGCFLGAQDFAAGYRPSSVSPLLTRGADLGYVLDLDGQRAREYVGAYG